MKDFGAPGMPPRGGGFARRQTEASRPDERLFRTRTFDAARDFRGAAQVVDQRRMADGGLDRFKRGFFDDGGMERAPANILAMRQQPVSRPEDAAVGFAGHENRLGEWNSGQLHTVRAAARRGSPIVYWIHTSIGPGMRALSRRSHDSVH